MSEKRTTLTTKMAFAAILLMLTMATACPAQENEDLMVLPDGSKVNLAAACPVCGMRVGGDLTGGATYSYRDGNLVGFAGVAASIFKDGHVVGFEGARCLFIYNTVPKRFGVDVSDIVKRYVTDFETKKMIDVSRAFFVLGSSVKGPMGYDLIGFTAQKEAETFKNRYDGKRVVQMNTVNRKDVEREKGVLQLKQ